MSARDEAIDAADRARAARTPDAATAWFHAATGAAWRAADEYAAAGDALMSDEWQSIAAGYAAELDAARAAGWAR